MAVKRLSQEILDALDAEALSFWAAQTASSAFKNIGTPEHTAMYALMGNDHPDREPAEEDGPAGGDGGAPGSRQKPPA